MLQFAEEWLKSYPSTPNRLNLSPEKSDLSNVRLQMADVISKGGG